MLYEFTVLLDPKVADDKAMELKTIEHINKAIIDNNFYIKKVERLGLKRLAYKIRGNEFAVYHVYTLSANKRSSSHDLANEVNRDENCIRYLLIALEPKKHINK